MRELYDGPELFGVPTQEQLDAQLAQMIAQGWDSEPGYIEFRCDRPEEHYDVGFVRCTNTIEIKTSRNEYTVAAYQEARAAMVAAGWTWGGDYDYCPEHSK